MGKYYGYFRDVNDKLYVVDIENKQIQGDQEITLADPPFVTTMDSDGDSIYAPIKSQGATIKIAQQANDYYFEIYANDALSTKVTLYSGVETNPRQNKEWIGYVTPCMYDQGINTYIEPLEIECVDPISVLKDIPYRTTNEKDGALTKEVATFKNILGRTLGVSKQLKHLYITKNVQLEYGKNDSIIEIFKCSENNFYDQKSDKYQTDDDVAWSSYEVLYQVIQYLGYVCYSQGENVYIMDYDAIKRGDNSYFHYTMDGTKMSSSYELVTLSNSKLVEGKDHHTSSETMSLDTMFNKVKVTDKFNTYDDPDDSTFEENITGTYDPLLDGGIGDSDLTCHYDLGCTFERDEKEGGNIQVFAGNHWAHPKKDSLIHEYHTQVACICVVKFYFKPNYQFYHYSKVGDQIKNIDNLVNFNVWGNMLEYNGQCRNVDGAYYTYFYKKYPDEGEYNKWYNKHKNLWKSYSKQQKYDAFKEILMVAPEKVGLSPSWILINPQNSHINYDQVYNYPFFQYTSKDEAYVLGGTDSYILISGQISYHDESNTPYHLRESDAPNCHKEGDWKVADEIYLPASLRWGDQWWNGEGWVEAKTTFPLRWMDPSYNKKFHKSDLQNKNLFIAWHDFLDTAQANGIDDKGCYIPAPPFGNLEGGIEFTIYANRDIAGRSNHRGKDIGRGRYYSYVYNLQNFKLKVYKGKGLFNDRDFSDTIYTNHPTEESVNAMDDIEFRVCTYDDKSNNHSSVTMEVNGSHQFVNETVNTALYKEQVESNTMDGKMCQEYQMVYKTVKQYQEPRLILDYDLMGIDYPLYSTFTNVTFTDRVYFIKEITKDYKYQRSEIKLLQKY